VVEQRNEAHVTPAQRTEEFAYFRLIRRPEAGWPRLQLLSAVFSALLRFTGASTDGGSPGLLTES